MTTVSEGNTVERLGCNERMLKLGAILMGTMHVTTVNNEVCVGELLCFLKQIYYPKFRKDVPGSIDGRGVELMQQAEERAELRGLLLVQVETVKMIKDLIERVEEEEEDGEMEETTNVPKHCVADSK